MSLSIDSGLIILPRFFKIKVPGRSVFLWVRVRVRVRVRVTCLVSPWRLE